MKRKYTVEVAEVHFRLFSVVAENEEEAKTLVSNRSPQVVDLRSLEYGHELNQDAWHIEEDPEPEAPSVESSPKSE